jgi:hypothetical protein
MPDNKCNRYNFTFAWHILDFHHGCGIIDETAEISKIIPKVKL